MYHVIFLQFLWSELLPVPGGTGFIMFPTLHFHTSSASLFCSENPAAGYAHTEQNEIMEAKAHQRDH